MTTNLAAASDLTRELSNEALALLVQRLHELLYNSIIEQPADKRAQAQSLLCDARAEQRRRASK